MKYFLKIIRYLIIEPFGEINENVIRFVKEIFRR